MAFNLFQTLNDLGKKYGPAFIIVNQALGWISFIAIYVLLEYSDFDVISYMTSSKDKDSDSSSSSSLSQLAQTGGPFAIAFALNRLLTPIRLGLTVVLLPLTANSINAFVNPWLSYFGFQPFDAPAPETVKEDKKD